MLFNGQFDTVWVGQFEMSYIIFVFFSVLCSLIFVEAHASIAKQNSLPPEVGWESLPFFKRNNVAFHLFSNFCQITHLGVFGIQRVNVSSWLTAG